MTNYVFERSANSALNKPIHPRKTDLNRVSQMQRTSGALASAGAHEILYLLQLGVFWAFFFWQLKSRPTNVCFQKLLAATVQGVQKCTNLDISGGSWKSMLLAWKARPSLDLMTSQSERTTVHWEKLASSIPVVYFLPLSLSRFNHLSKKKRNKGSSLPTKKKVQRIINGSPHYERFTPEAAQTRTDQVNLRAVLRVQG